MSQSVEWKAQQEGDVGGHGCFAYTPSYLLVALRARPLGTLPAWWWEIRELPCEATVTRGSAPTLEDAKASAESALAEMCKEEEQK